MKKLYRIHGNEINLLINFKQIFIFIQNDIINLSSSGMNIQMYIDDYEIVHDFLLGPQLTFAASAGVLARGVCCLVLCTLRKLEIFK